MAEITITIAGRAHAGKSSIATLIAQTLEEHGIKHHHEQPEGPLPRVTFSDRLKAVAERLVREGNFVQIKEVSIPRAAVTQEAPPYRAAKAFRFESKDALNNIHYLTVSDHGVFLTNPSQVPLGLTYITQDGARLEFMLTDLRDCVSPREKIEAAMLDVLHMKTALRWQAL